MDLHLFLILLYLKLHWRRFYSVMFFSLDERTGGGHDALQTHYRDRLWPGFPSYQFVLRHVHSWRLKQILGSLHKHSHTIWALRAQSLWFNTKGSVAPKNIKFDAKLGEATGHHCNAEGHALLRSHTHCMKLAEVYWTINIVIATKHWIPSKSVQLLNYCTNSEKCAPHY